MKLPERFTAYRLIDTSQMGEMEKKMVLSHIQEVKTGILQKTKDTILNVMESAISKKETEKEKC